MKKKECLKIAFTNILVAKSMSIKIIIGLSVNVMILFCMSIYFFSFYKQVFSFSTNHINNCYLYSEISEVNSCSDYIEAKKVYKKLAEKMKIQDASYLFQMRITKNDLSESRNPNVIKNAMILINGTKYKGLPEWNCNNIGNAYETNEFVVDVFDQEFPVFSNAVIQHYNFENSGAEYIIGRLPQNPGELIISNYMLECFGISIDEQKELIGKKISLYYDGNICYCKNYMLTGIFDARILSIREMDNYFPCIGHIVINYATADFENLSMRGTGFFRFYGTDFKNLEEIYLKNKEISNIEISPLGEVYVIMNKQVSVANQILRIIMIHFVIAIIIYISSILSFFFKRNRNYFVMLRAIGLGKRQLYLINIFEMIIMILISILCGLYCSIFVLAGLGNLYESITGFHLVITPMPTALIIVFIFLSDFIIFCIQSNLNCKRIINTDIANMLHS